ncbi:hypothetical protein N7471_001625 [Penicillium samsonianum]|uniref:uncharacterized protein n=1 Tax=Penicillium samsonianum TaxID=1882272 RepID=UPI002547368D|nr:uncharacterized protein N7471_001625 [Penicillium samsonianum]KAJ6150426.1 hypothetical protein N7471_001625 [Penicillium samsonianum]
MLTCTAVPHGGYTASIFYRAAAVHFANNFTHRFSNPPAANSTPNNLFAPNHHWASYFENTKYEDRLEDGVALSGAISKDSKLEVKAAAYINASPPDTEGGPSYNGTWELGPAPVPGTRSDGSVDLLALAKNKRDSAWVKFPPLSPAMAAMRNLEVYAPNLLMSASLETRAKQVVDQWLRFTPGGKVARWSNEAVMFLVDIFPAGLDRLAAMESHRLLSENVPQREAPENAAAKDRFWFPTVSLNIDLKTRLPIEGVEWLYSRVVTRKVQGSRADLDVVVLDQMGDLVATSTQVALVVDASRNIKGRDSGGKL